MASFFHWFFGVSICLFGLCLFPTPIILIMHHMKE